MVGRAPFVKLVENAVDRVTRLTRYKKVLRLRALGMTLQQIGEALKSPEYPEGVSRERARQILNDARNDGKPRPRKSGKVRRR